MARAPKKPMWYRNKRTDDRRSRKSSSTREPMKMLDLRRERVFMLNLDETLCSVGDLKNKDVYKANILLKASQKGINNAREYLDRITGDGLNSELSERIDDLLEEYSVYR